MTFPEIFLAFGESTTDRDRAALPPPAMTKSHLLPIEVVLADLFHVMRNVFRLYFHPITERHDSLVDIVQHVAPYIVGNTSKDYPRHLAQTPDHAQCVFSALVTAARHCRPSRDIDAVHDCARLGDKLTTSQIGAGLAVGKMEDNFMSALPTFAGAITPHASRALMEGFGENVRPPREHLKHLSPLDRC